MLRHRLWMLLLCGFPLWSLAADGGNTSCQSAVASEEAFVPVTGQALSRSQEDALRRLFRGLDGGWQGSAVEQVCMVSGNTQTRAYSVQLTLDASSKQLLLSGQYKQTKSGAMRRFSRKLLLTGEGLRVDHPSRVGEVALRRADLTGLAYAQRYRTVHELPEDPNTAPVQPNPVVAVLNAVTSTLVGGDDTTATADATDDGTTTDDDAADSNSNLVTGETQVAPQPAPVPRRRSLTREERFSLQVNGSRQLILTQDFYTQGAFTGSMRWQLQRH